VRRGLRRPQTEWDVLLKDQHEGYITWEQFERNQRVIADNATGKGSATVKGAVRRGGRTSRDVLISYSRSGTGFGVAFVSGFGAQYSASAWLGLIGFDPTQTSNREVVVARLHDLLKECFRVIECLILYFSS
jgi:hypothetical protein